MRLVKPLPRTRCSAFPYLLAVTVMLGTLNPTLATSQNVPGELVFRRVAVSSREIPMGPFGNQVPAEGRYLATADWDNTGADLAIVDLQSKTLTRITDRNARGDSLDAAWAAVFSPDGTQIAYQWAHFSRSDGVENQIRIIGRDGSGERTLITESEPNWIEPKAWTPDGEFIIAHQRRVGATGYGDVELVLVSVRDGNRRVLQRLDRSPGGLFVSPDGRHAAFDLTLDESGNADVHVLDLAGGDSRALVSGNGDDRLMGWDTDGSGIFFYSNRELSGGIWRLPRPPVLLSRGPGRRPDPHRHHRLRRRRGCGASHHDPSSLRRLEPGAGVVSRREAPGVPGLPVCGGLRLGNGPAGHPLHLHR